MAKSKYPRTLIEEETGKEYQFDRNALKEILHSRTDKKKHITRNSILEKLEEQYGLSVAQVSKWLSGANGIGSIENAKIISEFLGIDYHDILIDINLEKGVEKIMYNEEKRIINKVFSECVAVLYKVNEWTNIPKLTRTEKLEYEKNRIKDLDSLIRNMHELVDQNSLIIKKYDRYNLHKILIELNEYIYGVIKSDRSYVPERWEEMDDTLAMEEAIDFPTIHTREFYLENAETDDSYIYLIDEIALASNMGLTQCITPTDKEWKEIDEIDDYTCFGYVPNNERYGLTPSIIWIDLMIERLTMLFKIDFPRILDER